MSDFGSGSTLITRIAHRCEWCGETIEAKTTAYHYKGQYEGEWQNWYMHTECHEAHSNDLDHGGEFMPYENERPKPPQMTLVERYGTIEVK